jgi:hypothetical protein
MMVPVVPIEETKCVTGAVGIAPDFGAGGAVVGPVVVRVGKLVEHQVTTLRYFVVGVVNGFFHRPLFGGQDHFGPESFHRQDAFLGGVFRHYQFDLHAAESGNHGKCNAGVAAGGFDQFGAGLQFSAFEGTFDHAVGGPVFYAAPGVVPFELAVEADAGFARNVVQLHEGSIANQVE